MWKLDDRFAKLLMDHDLDKLNAHAGTICGVWADYRIAYLNPAWFKFAKTNDGEPDISSRWGLGTSILDCVEGEIRDIYASWFEFCLQSRQSWSHDIECSTEKIYRLFRQVVHPLGQGEGLLIVNAPRIESPDVIASRTAYLADLRCYQGEDGFLHQCSNCRMMKNFLESERWDWVPDWIIRRPGKVKFTFCPACATHIIPAPDRAISR